MTKSSRTSRREAARQPEAGSAASRWLLPVAGVAIVGAALVAILLSQGGAGPVASASPSPGASASAGAVVPEGPPTITGTALPTFTGTLPDPAKGLAAPVVAGHDYSGAPVSIAPSGRVTMVVFAAHWCPHCQREIPVIQTWVNGGGLPADVDIVTVSTGIEPTAPNYPPEAWFEREGWTAPIIVDPTGSVAQAYGLGSYPFFVILDGNGDVFARFVGETPTIDLERILAAVPRT